LEDSIGIGNVTMRSPLRYSILRDLRLHAILCVDPGADGDYDERTGLTSTRMFFSILGSLIAFTLPLWLVGGFQPGHARPRADDGNRLWAGICHDL